MPEGIRKAKLRRLRGQDQAECSEQFLLYLKSEGLQVFRQRHQRQVYREYKRQEYSGSMQDIREAKPVR